MRQTEPRGRQHMAETVQEQQTVEINKGRASREGQDRGGSQIPPGPKLQLHPPPGPALPWSLDSTRFLSPLFLCDLPVKSACCLPSWGLSTAAGRQRHKHQRPFPPPALRPLPDKALRSQRLHHMTHTCGVVRSPRVE